MSFTDNNKTNDSIGHHDQDGYYYGITSTSGIGTSEIEEEEENHAGVPNGDVSKEIKELFEMKKFSPMPSIKEEHDKGSVLSGAEDHSNTVYVAVGKSPSSLDALDWTLKNAVSAPSNMVVYLIHIYSEIKQIPTPLGKLPMSQVSPQQVETFMAQERGKRRELLQKFLYRCTSANVNVETILIESDAVPKAILDLIDILRIRKLVVGTTKSSLRKLRSRKGTGTADQILKSAPETCEVKIICEGNEVIIDQPIESRSPRGNVDSSNESDNSNTMHQEQQREVKDDDDDNKHNEAISCMCFKSKFG